jgi:hypothetical protein
MKRLSVRTALGRFRRDVVFLHANLCADTRAGVSGLAPEVAARIAELRTERELFEAAEAAALEALARQGRRTRELNQLFIRFASYARGVDRRLYEACFPNHTASKLQKLSRSRRSLEWGRIMSAVAALPEGDEIRALFEQRLSDAFSAVQTAEQKHLDARIVLVAARARLQAFKEQLDLTRVQLEGKLLVATSSREEANSFFLSYARKKATEEEGEEAEEAEDEDAEEADEDAEEAAED